MMSKKKYYCNRCRRQFASDTMGNIICPICHTDDEVHEVKDYRWVYACIGALVLVAVGITCYLWFKPTPIITLSADIVEAPFYNDNGTFSFAVRAVPDKNAKNLDITYVLMADEDEIARSENGVFSNIKAADDNVDYIVYASVVDNPDVIPANVEVQLSVPDYVPLLLSMSVVDEPVYNDKSGTYSFAVKAKTNKKIEGLDIVYMLKHDKIKISENTTGKFTDVVPSKSGVFTVIAYAKNDDTIDPVECTLPELNNVPQKEADKEVASSLTIAEVQRWVDDLKNDNSNNPFRNTKAGGKVERPVRFEYTNLREGEDKPATVSKIHTQLVYGFWKGLVVKNITCNPTTGKLKSVTCEIVYP